MCGCVFQIQFLTGWNVKWFFKQKGALIEVTYTPVESPVWAVITTTCISVTQGKHNGTRHKMDLHLSLWSGGAEQSRMVTWGNERDKEMKQQQHILKMREQDGLMLVWYETDVIRSDKSVFVSTAHVNSIDVCMLCMFYTALCVHTRQVRDLVEELVLHAGKLVVGVLWGGRARRRGLPLLLLLGRPAEPRPRHADQSHHCSAKTATTNGNQLWWHLKHHWKKLQ